ncbi:hypothetical protein [Emticicia fluvialis]|uniref:hypothetical protein n=1 Tax=Emticicia fluvialis TaxID=2974474 RepID=UPI002165E0ED|nr:hypothetical protein [Emticicia fluvialis]
MYSELIFLHQIKQLNEKFNLKSSLSLCLSSFFIISCEKEETKAPIISLSVKTLKNDIIFNEFASLTMQMLAGHSNYLENRSKKEVETSRQYLSSLSNKQSLSDSDYYKMSTSFGFSSEKLFVEKINRLEVLKNLLHEKYSDLSNKPYIFEQALSEFVKKRSANLKENDDNCRAIYESCINVATVGGAACILLTSGLGVPLCLASAAAAMEYCRQQAIGCH